MATTTVRVRGLAQLQRDLRRAPPTLYTALRGALRGIARTVRQEGRLGRQADAVRPEPGPRRQGGRGGGTPGAHARQPRPRPGLLARHTHTTYRKGRHHATHTEAATAHRAGL